MWQYLGRGRWLLAAEIVKKTTSAKAKRDGWLSSVTMICIITYFGLQMRVSRKPRLQLYSLMPSLPENDRISAYLNVSVDKITLCRAS